MSPFVEPRLKPIGNTFLDCENATRNTVGQLQRRHSFSYVAYAHLAFDLVEIHRAAHLNGPICHTTPAVEVSRAFSPLAVDVALGTGSQTPAGFVAKASSALQSEANGEVGMRHRQSTRKSGQCGGRRNPGDMDGMGGVARPQPREELVRELLKTGASALERAAAIAKDMRRGPTGEPHRR